MLSLKQLQDVCLAYTGGANKCAYAKPDSLNYSKWYCVKLKASEKDKIDEKMAEFVEAARQKGIDPVAAADQLGVPLSDNCAGYPILRYIEQGYDQP